MYPAVGWSRLVSSASFIASSSSSSSIQWPASQCRVTVSRKATPMPAGIALVDRERAPCGDGGGLTTAGCGHDRHGEHAPLERHVTLVASDKQHAQHRTARHRRERNKHSHTTACPRQKSSYKLAAAALHANRRHHLRAATET